MEIANHSLDALVGANVFRTTATSGISSVILLEPNFAEGLVDQRIVARFFGIRLVTLEIVQRGCYDISRVLVGTDDVDGVAHCFHGLLIDKDFVFFGEFTTQHQNLFTGYFGLQIGLIGAGVSRPRVIRMGNRESNIRRHCLW